MSLDPLHIIDPSENLIPTPINDNSNKIMTWANSVNNDIDVLKNFGNIIEATCDIRLPDLNKMYFYRMGNLVYATTLGWCFSDPPRTIPNPIGTIPSGFRPVFNGDNIISTASVAINNNNNVGWYYTSFNKNGNMTLHTNAGIAFEYRDHLLYMTEDPKPTQLESDKKKNN